MRKLHSCWTLLLLGLLLKPAASDEPRERTITVTGQGKVTAPPDMATIHTAVVTQSSEAAAALEANNRAMERIMRLLKDHHIASKDIQTSNFNVQPQYKRDPRSRTLAEIIGYRVTNQLRVRVRNLHDLGEILDALVEAGSNQLSGISFGIDDPTGLMNQARARAMADARSRADIYAQSAGVRRGKVLSISEQPVQVPQPRYFARGAEMAMGASVPVAPGEQEISVTVHVIFALEDAD